MAVNRRRSPMPPRPSEFLRDLMKDFGIKTQDSLAELLGTTRFSTNQLLNNKRAISPEMALKLGRLFSNSAEFWLNLQNGVDLYEARRRLGRKLNAIKPVRQPSTPDQMMYDADA